MPSRRSNKNDNSSNSSSFLPYDLPYMTDELRKRAKFELFEDEDTRIQSLKLLKSMLNDEKLLHYLDDENFLLSFLRARKFDVKRAFQLVKTFYTVQNKHYELYSNYDFNIVRKTLKENSVGFFPYRDEESCVILLISTERWNPAQNKMGDVMRALSSGLLHATRSPSTQVAGIKVIVDWKNFSPSKLPYISPTYLWLFAEALQNCFPARFKGVHMVNEGVLFSYVWAVLKQFLTKKLTDRFHFHGKNMAKLHKYFSPSILPVEYGGVLPPYDNSNWAELITLSADYFTRVHSHGIIKNKKRGSISKTKNTNHS